MHLALVVSAVALLLAESPVTIYVGPQVRDGFVDVDRSVLDSIADLKAALREQSALNIVPSENSADLRLYVLGRGSGSGDSDVGGWTGLYVATELRTGEYKRGFKGESMSWKACAKEIAKDLAVWLAANRGRLPRKAGQ